MTGSRPFPFVKPALADDLLQDVWFAVARQGTRYQPTARFRTWHFTMAHNRMVDHWRTQRSHLALGDGAGEGGLADTLAADTDPRLRDPADQTAAQPARAAGLVQLADLITAGS